MFPVLFCLLHFFFSSRIPPRPLLASSHAILSSVYPIRYSLTTRSPFLIRFIPSVSSVPFPFYLQIFFHDSLYTLTLYFTLRHLPGSFSSGFARFPTVSFSSTPYSLLSPYPLLTYHPPFFPSSSSTCPFTLRPPTPFHKLSPPFFRSILIPLLSFLPLALTPHFSPPSCLPALISAPFPSATLYFLPTPPVPPYLFTLCIPVVLLISLPPPLPVSSPSPPASPLPSYP